MVSKDNTGGASRHKVIIVAAGSGNRFGGDIPKQFALLHGRPVLMRTVDVFRDNLPGADIIVVLSPSEMSRWASMCTEYDFESPRIVAGGASRTESVRNALAAIADCDGSADTLVFIHDGARPLTDEGTVHRVIETARAKGACVPTVPVTDSLRAVASDGTTIAVDRAAFRAVQTPQGFEASAIIRAYALPYSPAFTDDASVYEADGGDVAICDGATDNIKITNAGDIEVAELLLRRRQSTVGADKR